MSHLTRLPGVPDSADIRPGMAYFPGTGPYGKTCNDCAHRGYWRAGKTKFNARTGLLEQTRVRSGGCREFLRLTHPHGPTIQRTWQACKYYVARSSAGARS
ncbi:hypothetical protein [Bradyrhizobium neotropicale]|uniref:hypothetical protein n=1 Tax=Bradyrhizobium neotropicale TaxID=1497615 RepID=UPI001AD61FBF|nr:hypothetical protein [Bradyrhizobium neotropicale]MBO4228165.1 hypothetical protein [Bradyrhizobium neotropicale]